MSVDSAKSSSYRSILKSSSIMGSSQGVSYLIGLFRTKFLAVLLGPTGVGIVGTFQALVVLLGVLTRCGIDSSAVREIAAEKERGGEGEGRTIAVVRKLAWISSFLGICLSTVFASLLSRYLFDSDKFTWAIAALGFGVALVSFASAQKAVLRGRRSVAELAKIGVGSAFLSTIVAIGLYKILGLQGIAPVIICSSAISLILTWIFFRRIEYTHVSISWIESLCGAKVLLAIGITFMWSALLTACVTFFLRAEVIRELGQVSSGIYQAAFGLSALFARFILQAMSTDYYPRLTEVSEDDEKVNASVNEQTEIGLLIGLPGLIGMMAFAQWLVPLFYSAEFGQASALIPWFIVGVYIQLISWPIGFIQQAKGSVLWLFISQTLANVILLGLSLWLMRELGLAGLAIAFASMYLTHLIIVYLIGSFLSGFKWSVSVLRILLVSAILVFLTFALVKFTNPICSALLGVPIVFFTGVFSLRTLCDRVGEHPLILKLLKVPGLSFLLMYRRF